MANLGPLSELEKGGMLQKHLEAAGVVQKKAWYAYQAFWNNYFKY